MFKIKKISTALIFIFSLISIKLYAFESVIGLGTGVRYTNQTLTQRITKHYTNPMSSQLEEEYIVRGLTNNGYGAEINLEYQARFKNLALALGLNNSNPSLQHTSNSDTKINLRTHYTDFYLGLLGNIFKTKSYTINFGAGVATGYFEVNTKNTNLLFNQENTKQVYLTPKFLLEGNYNINKHFEVFSRFILTPLPLLKKVLYNSSLEKDEDHTTTIDYPSGKSQDVPATVINNLIESANVTSISLNFGIRYKF